RAGPVRRRLPAPAYLHLLDRRLWRAVSGQNRRRVPLRAADQLWDPEGDLRTPARRLFEARLLRRSRPAPADDLRPPRLAQQGRVRLFLRHYSRTAQRQGGDPAGGRNGPPLARLAKGGGRVPAAGGGARSLAARRPPVDYAAG